MHFDFPTGCAPSVAERRGVGETDRPQHGNRITWRNPTTTAARYEWDLSADLGSPLS